MTLLLGATDAGLGACFLGNFRGEESLLRALGAPAGWRVFGSVLLGHPDGADHRSSSLDRPGPDAADRVHYGTWHGRRR
jgi:nitroreductase